MKLSRTTVVIIASIAAVLAAGALAIGAIPSADGTIHACVTTGPPPVGGKIRIIDVERGQTCDSSERPLVWNGTGPTGARGATGPTGATGATGPTGPSAAQNYFSDPSLSPGVYAITGTAHVTAGSAVSEKTCTLKTTGTAIGGGSGNGAYVHIGANEHQSVVVTIVITVQGPGNGGVTFDCESPLTVSGLNYLVIKVGSVQNF